MQPWKFKRFLFALILLFGSTGVWADFLEDANTIFDWAETEYPQYLAPAGQPTLSNPPWTYRYYPDTNAYLGVKDSGDVFFLNVNFGNPVFVGTVDDLLIEIGDGNGGGDGGGNDGGGSDGGGSDGGGNDGGGNNSACVNVPFVASGTSVIWSIDGVSAGQNVSGEIDTLYNAVTTSSASSDTTSTITSAGVKTKTDSMTEQFYDIGDGYMNITQINTTATTKVLGFGTSITTQVSFQPAQRLGPALEFCEGESWHSDSVKQTIVSSVGPTVVSDTPSLDGTVESIGEMMSTPAGSFDTVRVKTQRSDGTSTIVWTDTVSGVMVRQEDYDSTGSRTTTTVATSIN